RVHVALDYATELERSILGHDGHEIRAVLRVIVTFEPEGMTTALFTIEGDFSARTTLIPRDSPRRGGVGLAGPELAREAAAELALELAPGIGVFRRKKRDHLAGSAHAPGSPGSMREKLGRIREIVVDHVG